MKDGGIIHRNISMKLKLINSDNKLCIRNMDITYKYFNQEIVYYLDKGFVFFQ